MAERSPHVWIRSIGAFKGKGIIYDLPRIVFSGLRSGGDLVRLALIAGLHGDEPESVEAVVRLLEELVEHPRLAQGGELYIYPLANPSGFRQRTPQAGTGRLIETEFWRGSDQPEVYFLERELGLFQFRGIVILRAAPGEDALRAEIDSAFLATEVVEPALAPRLPGPSKVKVTTTPQSRLTDTPEIKSRPFVLTLYLPRPASSGEPAPPISIVLLRLMDLYSSFLCQGRDI